MRALDRIGVASNPGPANSQLLEVSVQARDCVVPESINVTSFITNWQLSMRREVDVQLFQEHTLASEKFPAFLSL
eukprot:13523229-Alexandrium_andersonii.AAC.1